jgi:hypothetical protein
LTFKVLPPSTQERPKREVGVDERDADPVEDVIDGGPLSKSHTSKSKRVPRRTRTRKSSSDRSSRSRSRSRKISRNNERSASVQETADGQAATEDLLGKLRRKFILKKLQNPGEVYLEDGYTYTGYGPDGTKLYSKAGTSRHQARAIGKTSKKAVAAADEYDDYEEDDEGLIDGTTVEDVDDVDSSRAMKKQSRSDEDYDEGSDDEQDSRGSTLSGEISLITFFLLFLPRYFDLPSLVLCLIKSLTINSLLEHDLWWARLLGLFLLTHV